MDDEVVAAAAHRGYVLAWHGGGCTAVLQCIDRHLRLHQRLSARYQELEMADLAAQAELRPEACPLRDSEDCLRGVTACWNAAAMRKRAAEGHC